MQTTWRFDLPILEQQSSRDIRTDVQYYIDEKSTSKSYIETESKLSESTAER